MADDLGIDRTAKLWKTVASTGALHKRIMASHLDIIDDLLRVNACARNDLLHVPLRLQQFIDVTLRRAIDLTTAVSRCASTGLPDDVRSSGLEAAYEPASRDGAHGRSVYARWLCLLRATCELLIVYRSIAPAAAAPDAEAVSRCERALLDAHDLEQFGVRGVRVRQSALASARGTAVHDLFHELRGCAGCFVCEDYSDGSKMCIHEGCVANVCASCLPRLSGELRCRCGLPCAFVDVPLETPFASSAVDRLVFASAFRRAVP